MLKPLTCFVSLINVCLYVYMSIYPFYMTFTHCFSIDYQPIHIFHSKAIMINSPIVIFVILFIFSTRSYMETKGWDVFRTIPPEQESGSEAFDTKYIGYTVKFLKVLAYIVCFLVVLGGSVISKATVLFMTSQIRPQKSILHCNLDLERDKSYQAEISLSERVAWIWCLFFVFVTPEIGTFVRSTRITMFKTMRVCSGTDFLVVFFFEALQTSR